MLRASLQHISTAQTSVGKWAFALATIACASASVTMVARPKRSRSFDGVPGDGVTTLPSYDVKPSVSEVKCEPDLTTTSFSAQNAFYMARMSKIAYSPKSEVEGILKGNSTSPGMGFEHFYWFQADPAVSGRSVLDAIEDTEAYVAANDDMLLVVFRGTKELTDWTTNLKLFPRNVPHEWGIEEDGCEVHMGFDEGVDTVWLPSSPAGMYRTIKRLYNEEGKNRKLFIAGHSLGGALATIAAARLVFHDDMKISAMYTIGSPKVFNGKMATLFDSKVNHGVPMKERYFRCTNNNDVVPRVYMPPFRHVGTQIYLDRFGIIDTASFADHALGRLSALFRGSMIDGINDHSSSEYVRLFKQVVVHSRLSLLDKTKSVVKDAVDKVNPVKKDENEAKEQELEAAKVAVLKASKETVSPDIRVTDDVLSTKEL